MAMDLSFRLSYHRRLFVLLMAFAWVLMVCFLWFQYGREKHYKAENLDAELQLLNIRMLDALSEGVEVSALPQFARKFTGDMVAEELRITLMDTTGRVLYDTSLDTMSAANHRGRPEVEAAMLRGAGYSLRRHSESTGETYFYSAMRGDNHIIRTAAPYTLSLNDMLAADRGFIWFMLSVALFMSVAAYFATRRLGHTISRLNAFAKRVERGERVDASEHFPHDELGNIADNIVRLYATLQQTTADRDREHALALHAEKERIRIKKQLTNNINHELKTPVAAIQGYIETLLANPDLDAERRRSFLEKSAAQSERLRSLLRDVGTITRMDDGGELIQREEVVLNDIIAEVAADMELKPEEQRLRVNIDFDERVTVVGSPSLLMSIFRNLADNAAAYSGGRDMFISLVENDAEHCAIVVADNGIGVDEEALPHLFERFFRVDKGRSRRLGGTGLGLAIVRNAVAIHGGDITVRNRKSGGLEFRFTLSKR